VGASGEEMRVEKVIDVMARGTERKRYSGRRQSQAVCRNGEAQVVHGPPVVHVVVCGTKGAVLCVGA